MVLFAASGGTMAPPSLPGRRFTDGGKQPGGAEMDTGHAEVLKDNRSCDVFMCFFAAPPKFLIYNIYVLYKSKQ